MYASKNLHSYAALKNKNIIKRHWIYHIKKTSLSHKKNCKYHMKILAYHIQLSLLRNTLSHKKDHSSYRKKQPIYLSEDYLITLDKWKNQLISPEKKLITSRNYSITSAKSRQRTSSPHQQQNHIITSKKLPCHIRKGMHVHEKCNKLSHVLCN